MGPGRAGLGRGQAEANEDDPEQWPGWAAPVAFFAGYGKSQLMSQRHIYIEREREKLGLYVGNLKFRRRKARLVKNEPT